MSEPRVPEHPDQPRVVERTDEELGFDLTDEVPVYRSAPYEFGEATIAPGPDEPVAFAAPAPVVRPPAQPPVQPPAPSEPVAVAHHSVEAPPATPQPAPAPPTIAAVAAPLAAQPSTAPEPRVDSPAELPGRGTSELGLLLLRTVVGGLALLHSVLTLTGRWHADGLDAFADQIDDAGIAYAPGLAFGAIVIVAAAGALTLIGFITPLAAGVLVTASGLAWLFQQADEPGFQFIGPSGIELLTFFGAAAAALVLIGPGRYSADTGYGWVRRPRFGSAFILAAALAAAIGIWIVLGETASFI